MNTKSEAVMILKALYLDIKTKIRINKDILIRHANVNVCDINYGSVLISCLINLHQFEIAK
jgi:hypothetical protein